MKNIFSPLNGLNFSFLEVKEKCDLFIMGRRQTKDKLEKRMEKLNRKKRKRQGRRFVLYLKMFSSQ